MTSGGISGIAITTAHMSEHRKNWLKSIGFVLEERLVEVLILATEKVCGFAVCVSRFVYVSAVHCAYD